MEGDASSALNPYSSSSLSDFFDYTSSTCLFEPGYYTQYAVIVLFPVSVVLMLAIAFFVHVTVSEHKNKNGKLYLLASLTFFCPSTQSFSFFKSCSVCAGACAPQARSVPAVQQDVPVQPPYHVP